MGIDHKQNENDDPFSMNVYIIGSNLFSIYDIIKDFKKENCSIKNIGNSVMNSKMKI